MSLGSGLLFFFVLLCVFLLGIVFIPIQIRFRLEHQTEWHITISIYIWHIKKTIQIPDSMGERLDTFLQKNFETREKTHHSVQIYWKSMLSFLHMALQIAARHLSMEHLYMNCRVGWDRADYTAYSYGLFWTAVSFLPAKWLKNSEFVYIPDFQYPCRNISVQGIISCRVGQLIAILIAWFRLTVQTMLKQNRKEQINYES